MDVPEDVSVFTVNTSSAPDMIERFRVGINTTFDRAHDAMEKNALVAGRTFHSSFIMTPHHRMSVCTMVEDQAFDPEHEEHDSVERFRSISRACGVDDEDVCCVFCGTALTDENFGVESMAVSLRDFGVVVVIRHCFCPACTDVSIKTQGASFASLNQIAKVRDPGVVWCTYCSDSNPGIMKCERCEAAFYCNKTCQRMDWKRHRKWCRSVADARNTTAPCEHEKCCKKQNEDKNVEKTPAQPFDFPELPPGVQRRIIAIEQRRQCRAPAEAFKDRGCHGYPQPPGVHELDGPPQPVKTGRSKEKGVKKSAPRRRRK